MFILIWMWHNYSNLKRILGTWPRGLFPFLEENIVYLGDIRWYPSCQILMCDVSFREYGLWLPFLAFEHHWCQFCCSLYPKYIPHLDLILRTSNIYVFFLWWNPEPLSFVLYFTYHGNSLVTPKVLLFWIELFRYSRLCRATHWFSLAVVVVSHFTKASSETMCIIDT